MPKTPPIIQNKESDKYLAQLKKDLAKVENKNRELNSSKILDENKLKEVKAKMVQELFAMMKEIGVDPNDLNSINKFLAQLAERDPDLLALFEAAFNNLTGGDLDGLPSAPVKDPMDTGSVRPNVPISGGGSGVPVPAIASAPPIPDETTFQNLR